MHFDLGPFFLRILVFPLLQNKASFDMKARPAACMLLQDFCLLPPYLKLDIGNILPRFPRKSALFWMGTD